ncbi:MAG: hypothetical protein ABI142_06010, partial [Bryocella sp.]
MRKQTYTLEDSGVSNQFDGVLRLPKEEEFLGVFSYWTTDDAPHRHPMPKEAELAWRTRVGEFTVFGDAAVEAALLAWGTDAVETFRGIGIPACRSDLARLVLLFQHGGLYVDAHCGPG